MSLPRPRDMSRPGGEDAQDIELLEATRRGDEAAFAGLLTLYWTPLVRYARRILGSADAAEDVVQDAFVRLWERRGEWREASAPRVLLYTIVRNLSLNQTKSRAVRAARLAVRHDQSRVELVTPADLLEAAELARCVATAIAALPPRRREVLLLARHDGFSRAEIAELTGLSSQTVANYLAMAIEELRRALRPQTGGP